MSVADGCGYLLRFGADAGSVPTGCRRDVTLLAWRFTALLATERYLPYWNAVEIAGACERHTDGVRYCVYSLQMNEPCCKYLH